MSQATHTTQESSPALMVSVREAARLLSIGERRAYDLVRSGDIPAKRVGGMWRVSTQRLAEWARETDG